MCVRIAIESVYGAPDQNEYFGKFSNLKYVFIFQRSIQLEKWTFFYANKHKQSEELLIEPELNDKKLRIGWRLE